MTSNASPIFNIAAGAVLNLNAKLGAGSSSAEYSKTGGGTLVLGAHNGGGTSWNFSNGRFTVSQGIVRITHSSGAGHTSNRYTVSSGATLELAANYISNNGTLTLNGSGVNGVGAVYASQEATINSGTGSVILNTATTIGVADTKSLTISQSITGSRVLTKIDAGQLVLSGANTYSGGTTVAGGLLTIGTGGSLGSGTGVLTVNAGVLDLNGGNAGAGNFRGDGGTILNNATGTQSILTLGQNNGTGGIYQGVVADNSAGTGTIALAKIGAGAISLSGANTYTGGTTISGGLLNFMNTGAKPASGTVMVEATGAIGLGVGEAGFFSSADLDALYAGTMAGVTMDPLSGVGIDTSAGDFTYGTSQGGDLSLAKLGDNILTLTGSHSHTGGTTLYGGTLQLGASATMGAASNTLTCGSASTLDLGGTSQTQGNLALTMNTGTATLINGNLTLSGPSELVLAPSVLTSAALVADASGLGSLTINKPLHALVVAGATGSTTSQSSSLILSAGTNTITAAALEIGTRGAANTAGLINSGSVLLGTTNTIDTDSVRIGATRSEGNLSFQTSGLGGNPSVSFRGVAGGETRVSSFLVGYNSAGTIAGPSQTADFSPGSIDGRFGTLTVSRGDSAAGNNPSVNGNFAMGTGTLDATEIFISDNGIGGGNTPNTGTFIQNAGEVAVGTLTLGRRVGTSAAPSLRPTYHLGTATTGAVLRAGSIIAGAGVSASNSTRNIVWNNGTIRNLDSTTDLTINGSDPEKASDLIQIELAGTGQHVFHADGDRSITLGSATTVWGSGALTKDGPGTVILSGVNTYTGDTIVAAGTLSLRHPDLYGEIAVYCETQ